MTVFILKIQLDKVFARFQQVESELGKGRAFFVTLPIHSPEDL